MNQEQKLQQFAERTARSVLKNSIIEMDTGYLVFGQYNVQPEPNGYVVYQYDDKVGSFSNKQTAICWCIAEHHHQHRLSFEIKTLDAKKAQLAADITIRRQISERCRTQQTAEIIETKLEPKILYYKSVKAELEKCVNSAKYLQHRGFLNETARSSRG